MLTCDSNDITRLVGGLFSCHHGRISDSQFLFGIDNVRDCLLILKFVHVTNPDITAYCVGRELDLQLVTGLAYELGSPHIASEDDFLDNVEIFTGDGDDIPGKGLGRREGSDFHRLGESKGREA